MALTDEGGGMNTTMLVSPNGYAGGNNGGFGWGGDSLLWVILILCLGGGWGGFGGFGGFGMGGAMMGMGMMGMDYLYPWLNNSQNINDGFRDAQLHDSVTSVRDGISSLSIRRCKMTREEINDRIIYLLEKLGIIPEKSSESQETS